LIRLHTVDGIRMTRGTNTRKSRILNSAKPRKSKLPEVKEVSGEIVPVIRGQGKNPNGLTVKQENFARYVASGETLTGAYRAAYDAEGMSSGAQYTEASKLMDNPSIAQRVNDLVREKEAKSSHDGVRIKRVIIERLNIEAHDPDNPPSVRVRALELLGKLDIVGAFRDRIEAVTAEPPASDLAATLEARLRALLPSPDKA